MNYYVCVVATFAEGGKIACSLLAPLTLSMLKSAQHVTKIHCWNAENITFLYLLCRLKRMGCCGHQTESVWSPGSLHQ